MAERKLIPTITVVEENPPVIDIITFYEQLLGLPNILRALIGIDGDEVRNNVVVKHGYAALTMKHYPEKIDGYIDANGNLVIITDDSFDGDADKYDIDSNGNLTYTYDI